MEKINGVKAAMAAIFAGFTAIFGWFGWVVVIYVVSMSGDFLSGTAVAAKTGEWKSEKARDGLWHKCGSLINVGVAALADILIGLIINNIPSINLPFEYTVLFCPIVMIWYTVSEFGSIVENAGKMGAPVPGFLKKMIAIFKETIDATGNKITEVAEKPKPPDSI